MATAIDDTANLLADRLAADLGLEEEAIAAAAAGARQWADRHGELADVTRAAA